MHRYFTKEESVQEISAYFLEVHVSTIISKKKKTENCTWVNFIVC